MRVGGVGFYWRDLMHSNRGGLRPRVQGLQRDQGLGIRDQGSGFRDQGSGFRVQGSRCRVYMVTSLIRNCLILGPYIRPTPRALGPS